MARGADRISDLPEGVLHHILSLLPARDAVRTCVLARSWRNRWLSAPALRFACSQGQLRSTGPFVDGLLRIRRGGLPLDSCDFDLVADLVSCDYDLDLQGNRWIRRVLELKVRELRFRVSGKPRYPFKLEYTPLSSQHLTSLELTGVQDNDAVLDFYECPALESLKMERSHVRSTEMQSPSLKHLSIKSCFFDDIRTWMSFPSLVSFEFINNFATPPMLETMPC
jgi:hypothetical protein